MQIEQCPYLCENNACINESSPPIQSVCGNNIIEAFEQCDDGNTESGDSCSAHCLIESPFCREVCSISGSAINFELSIDRSGSMNRYLEPQAGNIFQKFTKIGAVREAAKFLVINAIAANPQTLIGISTFSTDVVNNNDLTNNLEQLGSTITYLYANGNADTNYNESIRYAVDKILAQGNDNYANLLIFLSDGQPTVTNSKDTSGTFVDPQDIQSAIDVAKYANENGITMVTVGFGKRAEINETLLAQMAAATNGRYFFVDSYEDVTNLYEAIGENTCQMICENPTCAYNSDCDDENPNTIDTCINPGTLQSYCSYNQAQCTLNSQCGVSSTQRICSGNNVIDRITAPACISNSCINQTNDIPVENCLYGCANNACLTAPTQCSQDTDCSDNNALTIDRCVNNQCIYLPLFCTQNTECGTDRFISSGFCSGNDIYGLFLSFACTNNQCSYSTDNLLLTDCLFGCSNGACNTEPLPPCALGYTQCADGVCRTDCGSNFNCNNNLICESNEGCECSDCYGFNDNCASGLVCNSNAEVCSFCPAGTIYNPLTERCVILEECNSNAECNDGNANTQDECVNNNCINTPLACIQNNIECGIDGFIGSNFCLNNNVYGLFLNFTCSNNQCSYSASNLLIDDCLYGCSNGVCITAPPIECSLNSECNDNNARTADECVNPGQTNSYCMNTEVDCIIDTDCGITGFINDNFCSNNDIYRIFQTATCENPGTLQSNCMITAEQTLITDCNDNNPLTFDWCTNSQCSHNYPQCSDGLDNDGDRYVDYPADAGCSSQLDNTE